LNFNVQAVEIRSTRIIINFNNWYLAVTGIGVKIEYGFRDGAMCGG